MPEYTFVCEDCGAKFVEIFSFSQYDKAIKNRSIACCGCGKHNVCRSYEDDCINIAGSVIKSDSELRTVGDLADRNRDRMSDDHKEHLFRTHNDYRFEKPDDPLPTGMNRVKNKPKKTKWTNESRARRKRN